MESLSYLASLDSFLFVTAVAHPCVGDDSLSAGRNIGRKSIQDSNVILSESYV
jgi:hypothetical protein